MGRIQTRTWDDNEGKRHYVTEVICEEAYFADSRRPEGSEEKPFGSAEVEQPDGFFPIDDDDQLPF